MTETLPVQPWMAHPATRTVMAALETAGGEDSARFVGGCVRNALLKTPVSDVDIATVLEPPEVTAALEAAGIRAIPTGIEHGTITAVADGRPFEITTLRRDVETDGRRAVVAFTRDWAEDAARRDFRLNALYADARGRLFDPTGGGIEDARNGAIVFVGDARDRIREDALRILRFFRFLAWYGRGEPDREGLAACAELAPLVEILSAERIGGELLKLLAADDPRRAVSLMAEAGVLRRLAPRATGFARFDSLVRIETEILFEHDPLLRLAALLPDEPWVGVEVAQRLRLANGQRDRLESALATEPRLVSWMGPREMRRIVYRIGARTFCDRVLLAWAGSDRPASAVQWRALLPMAGSWTPPTLPLNGDEVAAAGVPHGPQIGAVLREVEAWWIDQDFPDDKLAVMERLKAVAQGMVY
jgi:poly(A) polymerase